MSGHNMDRRHELTMPTPVDLIVGAIEGGRVLRPGHEKEDDMRRTKRVDEHSLKARSQLSGHAGDIRVA